VPQSTHKEDVLHRINQCGQVANAGMCRYREERELLSITSKSYSNLKCLLISDTFNATQADSLNNLILPAKSTLQMSLELGGNAPFIVFDDADVDVAVKALINTKFRNAGQACIASNRILVQEGIYDAFTELLVKKVSGMKIGNGMDREVTIGEWRFSGITISLNPSIQH
jgi:Aldehyde dehydrogenase family